MAQDDSRGDVCGGVLACMNAAGEANCEVVEGAKPAIEPVDQGRPQRSEASAGEDVGWIVSTHVDAGEGDEACSQQ